MQSRLQSLIETNTSTAIGFVGSFAITYFVFIAMSNAGAGPGSIAGVTTILCTIWSLARGYCVRRYFARRHG